MARYAKLFRQPIIARLMHPLLYVKTYHNTNRKQVKGQIEYEYNSLSKCY